MIYFRHSFIIFAEAFRNAAYEDELIRARHEKR
jgi:hypothetical protein